VLADQPGQVDMAEGNSVTAKMNICAKYNRILTILVLVQLFIVPTFSQSVTHSDSLAKPGKNTYHGSESSSSLHSLYTGLGGGSNMIYMGTSISNNKPFYSSSVTYGYHNSLFASASISHLSETTPYLAFYNLALNYSHYFNSWFDISSDVAGYKTAESLKDSLFSDFAYINLTTGFDWKLIYTRISFSGLISDEIGFYLQVSNSRYFETREFCNGKAFIYFDPDIDILFGNLVKVETASGSISHGNAPPFSHAWKKPVNSTETYSEKFGLMDFEFSLPVTLSYCKFSLEAEAIYLLPVYSDPLYPEPKGFTFYLNAIYKIL
jgi:hypothetical protein